MAGKTLPPIVATLVADTKEFTAKMQEARGEMDETAESGSSSFSKLSALGGKALLGMAGAVAAVAAASVDLAMKNQEATNRLASNAGISVDSANKISNAFLSTADTSIFSGTAMTTAYASVAAQLGVTQGKALSAAQALGFMKTASDLAEASGESLDSATGDLAKTIQLYGLKATDAGNASNIMFNVARDTGGSIDTVTASFQKLHAQLGSATPPLNQVGGLLLDLTQHGESGRQATSALSTAFNGILAPTAAVTAAQNALGVSFTNAQTGALLPMSQIIGELQPKIAGMGDATAAATLKSLGFGTAGAKLIATINAGPAAFDKATASVAKHGSVTSAAQKQAQSLDHQIKLIEATAEDYGVKLGQWLIPKLEDLIHYTTEAFTWLGKNKDVLIALGVVVGGVVTAAITAFTVNTIGNFIKYVQDAATKIGLLGPATTEAAGDVTAGGSDLEGSASAVGSSFDAASTTVAGAMTAMTESVTTQVSLMKAQLAELQSAADVTMTNLGAGGSVGGGAASSAEGTESSAALDGSATALESAATSLDGAAAALKETALTAEEDDQTASGEEAADASSLESAAAALDSAAEALTLSGSKGVVGGAPGEGGAAAEDATGEEVAGEAIAGSMLKGVVSKGIGGLIAVQLYNAFVEKPLGKVIGTDAASTLGDAGTGAAIGFAIAGPFGALGGAALGAAFAQSGPITNFLRSIGADKPTAGKGSTPTHVAPGRSGLQQNYPNGTNLPQQGQDFMVPTAAQKQKTQTQQDLAKDSTIQKQISVLGEMKTYAAQQLSTYGKGSTEAVAAANSLKTTEEKWLPSLSKDKNTTAQVQKLTEAIAQAKATASQDKTYATEQSTYLKGAQTKLDGLQKTLATEKTVGASKAAIDNTTQSIKDAKQSIDLMKSDVSQYTSLSHTFTKSADTLSAKEALEEALGKINSDTTSLRTIIGGDGVGIKSLPDVSRKVTGTITMKAVG